MSRANKKSQVVVQCLKYAAGAALAFQAVHFIEHVAQLGYWIAHPFEAPWLTPWAVQGRAVLAVDGQLDLGNELLHLLGNLVFLGGLFAMVAYLQRMGESVIASLRIAVAAQTLHVLEHLALTATSAVVGTAIGLSTFLGLVEGPVMTSYRVWFHFLINLLATYYAIRASLEIRRVGLLVGTSPAEDRRSDTAPAPG